MSGPVPFEPGVRLPVSLVTGFLGSGKTTLLNRLLGLPDMARTAVVINEFGDVPLDQLFVESSDGEVMVLSNGCLCCDLQGDLEAVIGTLFGKRQRGDVPGFDRMIVETTGLADPAPIMQMLLNRPILTDNFALDSVITTIDAINGKRQLDDHPEAVNQAALADRLVMTKTDLSQAEDIAALAGILRQLNPVASLVRVPEFSVTPAKLFGAGHTRSIPEPVHGHLHNVETFSITFEDAVDWPAFSEWLTRLRTRHAEHLLRVKGVIRVSGEATPIAIHGVHHVFHPPTQVRSEAAAHVGSCLVFITQGRLRETIESEWRDAFPCQI